MSIYMGTQCTPPKSRSTESSRPYMENGVKKSGNFGLVRISHSVPRNVAHALLRAVSRLVSTPVHRGGYVPCGRNQLDSVDSIEWFLESAYASGPG